MMIYKEITALFLVIAYVFGTTTVAAMQLADEWQLAMSIRRSGHDNEEQKRRQLATRCREIAAHEKEVSTLAEEKARKDFERIKKHGMRFCVCASCFAKYCVDCSANRVNAIGVGYPHEGSYDHIKPLQPSSKL